MANKDNNWTIILERFYSGYSPLAFDNSLTEVGSSGMASTMTNVDVINGSYLTQGPALSNLSGTVNELISFIMDKAVSDDVSYAIGTASLFQLSSTTITNLRTINNCEDGESILPLKGNLYYFYNTSGAGVIGRYDLSSVFLDGWTTGLQKAPHPSAKKEDIMVFGNGRYAGVYLADSDTMDVEKLDFGNDTEVADVLYSNGYWYIVVNSGVTGNNRTEGQIFLYDGSALVSTLDDEAGVGFQRIGFIYRLNGIIYVAYEDLSSSGFIIGYLNGKAITPLQRFTGALPNFAQKTLFKNTILFLSSGSIYSAGSIVGELPYQLSQHASGGHSTLGAIAAPFGDVLVSSTDGASAFRLAKFSDFDTNCAWKSIIFPLSLGAMKGFIDNVTVLTKVLGSGASCTLKIESDQAVTTGSTKTIATTGKTRHYFNSLGLGQIEDFRVALDWSGGSASNDVAIRKIIINGHFVQNT